MRCPECGSIVGSDEGGCCDWEDKEIREDEEFEPVRVF